MKGLLILIFLLGCQNLYAIEQLEVQGLFPNKAVLLIDGNLQVLTVGQASAEGIRLISADSKSAVLEINGQQRKYQLGNTIHTNFKQPEIIREQVFADSNGMFLTHGAINGRQVKFLVDTGASIVAISSATAKKLGIQYRLDGKPMRASTASGVAEGWAVTLKTVKVGQIHQRNVPAMVIDGDHPREILLGMTFLNSLKVTKEVGKLVLEEKK